MAALGKEGVTQLFPVQAACYEHFMSGKDVIVRARVSVESLPFGVVGISDLYPPQLHWRILTPTSHFNIFARLVYSRDWHGQDAGVCAADY